MRMPFLFGAVLLLAIATENVATAQPQRTPALAKKPQRLKTHRPAVPGEHGLVTSGHPLASMSGVRILMQGGNAADAAVAVLATLNLTEPMMSGAGGNGFMTLYDQRTDRVYTLNATGAAPLALDPKQVKPKDLYRGMKAGCVPGLLGGWITMLDRFGTKSLKEVLAPAIEYAENGHPVAVYVSNHIGKAQAMFKQYPSTARIMLPEGRVPKPGERFKNQDLANTFKKLVEAEQNALREGKSRSQALQAAFDRFYKGDIAQEMARFYKANDGLFTAEDFARYEPIWSEPIRTNYRGYDVYTVPSTSRGGLEVLMQLNLIEGFDVAKLGHNSPQSLHLITECIKLAKSDIYHFVADPKFTKMPTAGMISEAYAKKQRAAIDLQQAMAYPDHGEPAATSSKLGSSKLGALSRRPLGPNFAEQTFAGCTTSFSVADDKGNVIACTPTLGSLWGTGVIVGKTGLFFNNGTRIGSTSPYPDDVNYLRGGQIPILNNSPIIVLKDGKFVLSLGTPGGESIGQTQFQVLLNVLDFGMEIQQAIEAPRIALAAEPNFYKPGAKIRLRVEGRLSPEVISQLGELGHQTQVTGEFTLGNMQGIFKHPKTGTRTAGADVRRMMYAIGW